MTHKILLDTDIGSDIDDALALAYLLKQPACQLLGITTVAGEATLRAEMASAICTRAGRDDIPIHAGADVSMLTPYLTFKGKAPQAAALGDWPRQRDFAPATAIDFLRRTIRQHPGEITLLAIGPLTNIGLLLATDPQIPTLIKELIIMGGCFTSANRMENNIRNDALAAAIVFGGGTQARPPRLVSFGLDVTLKCTLEAEECRARLTAPIFGPVRDFMEIWFKRQPRATFHDPLATAAIFQPDLCTYKAGQVRIATAEPTLGWSLFEPQAPEKNPPHLIATEVRAEAFFEHYFQIVGRGG